MRNLYWLVLIPILSTGCALLEDDTKSAMEEKDILSPVNHTSDSLHGHVEKLARQLLSTSQPFDISGVVAVGTILPSIDPGGERLPSQSTLGLQIQESLMTFATQAGLKVVEYKITPAIRISEQADMMLSREISDLASSIATDYFLTGTYTNQENSTIVNIRLIKIPENIVLAAATDYVPNDSMWSQSKVRVKNNQIYRNGY